MLKLEFKVILSNTNIKFSIVYYGLMIFLSHRKQRVISNGVCSNWSEVTSGIPQSSVHGPLLFTIFINDLPLYIASHIQIFADDTQIYNTVQDSGILKHSLFFITDILVKQPQ